MLVGELKLYVNFEGSNLELCVKGWLIICGSGVFIFIF
jgi:hypothetical protein